MSPAMTPEKRLERLSSVLNGARNMLIIVQNTPDPDAIAAAAALRELANQRHEIACSIGHSGGIWRAENLALLRYLSLNTRPLSELDIDRFDRLAMVDAQPGAGNVSFDASVRLDVVIDHHPIRRETRSARFTDIRSRYGATSTILYEYLKSARIEIAKAPKPTSRPSSDSTPLPMLAPSDGSSRRHCPEVISRSSARLSTMRGSTATESFRSWANWSPRK